MSVRTLDTEGNTAIHAAAKSGHVDVLLYFIDQGMPVDLVCKRRREEKIREKNRKE